MVIPPRAVRTLITTILGDWITGVIRGATPTLPSRLITVVIVPRAVRTLITTILGGPVGGAAMGRGLGE